MNPGFLIYRCRRCGEEVRNTHVPLVLTAVTLLQAGKQLPESWGPMSKSVSLIGVHECSSGGYGVTDLISGEEIKGR